jgi:hypothetical protein
VHVEPGSGGGQDFDLADLDPVGLFACRKSASSSTALQSHIDRRITGSAPLPGRRWQSHRHRGGCGGTSAW